MIYSYEDKIIKNLGNISFFTCKNTFIYGELNNLKKVFYGFWIINGFKSSLFFCCCCFFAVGQISPKKIYEYGLRFLYHSFLLSPVQLKKRGVQKSDMNQKCFLLQSEMFPLNESFLN